MLDTWAPPVPVDVDDNDSLRAFVARLAADGLWLFEAMDRSQLSDEIRTRVAQFIAQSLKPPTS